jgi:hypothetical protein
MACLSVWSSIALFAVTDQAVFYFFHRLDKGPQKTNVDVSSQLVRNQESSFLLSIKSVLDKLITYVFIGVDYFLFV